MSEKYELTPEEVARLDPFSIRQDRSTGTLGHRSVLPFNPEETRELIRSGRLKVVKRPHQTESPRRPAFTFVGRDALRPHVRDYADVILRVVGAIFDDHQAQSFDSFAASVRNGTVTGRELQLVDRHLAIIEEIAKTGRIPGQVLATRTSRGAEDQLLEIWNRFEVLSDVLSRTVREKRRVDGQNRRSAKVQP